jgi:hypothetical protein
MRYLQILEVYSQIEQTRKDKNLKKIVVLAPICLFLRKFLQNLKEVGDFLENVQKMELFG